MDHWFSPMGLALRVSTNSSKLAAAVCESYGPFGTSGARAAADLRFDFTYSADGSAGPLEYRIAPDCSELRIGERVALSIHPAGGTASGCFPESFVANRSSFRLHALHFALFASLPASGFLGVHAACVVINGCSVLLRGPHGTGKSVLAYAAASRGFRVLAGSTVWISPDDAAWWGVPRWIYLRHSARALFPQMPAGTDVLIGDERKIEINLAQAAAGCAAPGIIVFLERDSGKAAHLEPILKREALCLWSAGKAGNESSVPDYRARVNRLLDAPTYRLNCPDDLNLALDLISSAAMDRARC